MKKGTFLVALFLAFSSSYAFAQNSFSTTESTITGDISEADLQAELRNGYLDDDKDIDIPADTIPPSALSYAAANKDVTIINHPNKYIEDNEDKFESYKIIVATDPR